MRSQPYDGAYQVEKGPQFQAMQDYGPFDTSAKLEQHLKALQELPENTPDKSGQVEHLQFLIHRQKRRGN